MDVLADLRHDLLYRADRLDGHLLRVRARARARARVRVRVSEWAPP